MSFPTTPSKERTLSVIGLLLVSAMVALTRTKGQELLAVSLRTLSEQTNSAAREFFGINRVSGLVLDLEQFPADCLLVGFRDPSRPPVNRDDFAVAYKSIREGLIPPGCSLDPVSPEGNKYAVRILGVPAQTRFARVMIDADILLKQISLGVIRVSEIQSAREREIQKREIGAPTRFWFVPRTVNGVRSGSAFYLTECSLMLKQEALAGLSDAGSGRENVAAAEFAQEVTDNYASICKERPIYYELESLCRHVAIARMLVTAAENSARLSEIDRIIFGIPIETIDTPVTVQGFSLSATTPEDNARSAIKYTGGIDITIQVNVKSVGAKQEQVFAQVQLDAIAARPSKEAAVWTVESDAAREFVVKVSLQDSADAKRDATIVVQETERDNRHSAEVVEERSNISRAALYTGLALGVTLAIIGITIYAWNRRNKSYDKRGRTEMGARSNVFLSYSRKDAKAATRLVRDLTQLGVTVYRDVHAIPGGVPWREEIVSAINGSRAVVILLSKNALASDHVPKEVDVGARAGKALIPVTLEPTALTGELSYQLGHLQAVLLYEGPREERIRELVRSCQQAGAQHDS